MILKGVSTLFIFSLLLFMIVLIFYLSNVNLKEDVSVFTMTGNIIDENYDLSNSSIFRFNSSEIGYSIDKDCSINQISNIQKSFFILNNLTVLSFYSTEKNEKILITCLNPNLTLKEDLILGEGGPDIITQVGNNVLINHGKVNIYDEEVCAVPLVTIHEILHVLGFNHTNDTMDVMYPVSNCNQKINNETINAINNIYESPSLPDLLFRKINLSPHKDYIDFDIEIYNNGLTNANDVNFSINGEDLNRVYELGNISIGGGKIIKVRNLPIFSTIFQLEIYIDKEKNILEVNEDNNQRILSLNSS